MPTKVSGTGSQDKQGASSNPLSDSIDPAGTSKGGGQDVPESGERQMVDVEKHTSLIVDRKDRIVMSVPAGTAEAMRDEPPERETPADIRTLRLDVGKPPVEAADLPDEGGSGKTSLAASLTATAKGVVKASAGIVNRTLREDSNGINDERFIEELKRLFALKMFVAQEAVDTSKFGPTALNLGSLNSLHGSFGKGRSPTQSEWDQLERQTSEIFSALSEAQRRRFLLGKIPWWIAVVPAVFTILAIIALIVPLAYTSDTIIQFWEIVAYVLWITLLGAIGSLAFVGMNALSVQSDATFDLNNHRLVVMRVSLGALFGLVITLPFGFQGFIDFVSSISAISSRHLLQENSKVSTDATVLLMPFVLGFSTSLVISIMNRMVEAIQTLMGGSDARKTTVVVASSNPAQH